MPKLIPSRKFLEDVEGLRADPLLRKKLAKSLNLLGTNPLHPGLHLERIINDPTAWSVRVDRRYRISLDPKAHQSSGGPDWNRGVILLRILDHDDLYKKPR